MAKTNTEIARDIIDICAYEKPCEAAELVRILIFKLKYKCRQAGYKEALTDITDALNRVKKGVI